MDNLSLPIQRKFCEKLKFFSDFLVEFCNARSFWNILKKNEPRSSNSSEVIDSETQKRSSFWKPFHSERVKKYHRLLKTAEKYFYPIFTSVLTKISSKQSVSVNYKILGLSVNTLNRGYQYSRSNTEKLPLHIQRKSFEKLKLFLTFLWHFWNVHYILNLSKNMSLIAEVFLKLLTVKEVLT